MTNCLEFFVKVLCFTEGKDVNFYERKLKYYLKELAFTVTLGQTKRVRNRQISSKTKIIQTIQGKS